MPSTTPDNFPYEILGDQPGETLHGGLDGTHPILAEQVQTKFQSTDGSLSSLAARVTALENGTGGVGWIPIATGTDSGASFSIDLTDGGRFPNPPRWNAVQLLMRYDMSESTPVRMRINGDDDAVYYNGRLAWDAETANADTVSYESDATSWAVASGATISTNNMQLMLFHAAADPGLLGFQSTSNRMSFDSANVMRFQPAWGALKSAKTPVSLELFADSGTFSSVWFWALGLRMEHPS